METLIAFQQVQIGFCYQKRKEERSLRKKTKVDKKGMLQTFANLSLNSQRL